MERRGTWTERIGWLLVMIYLWMMLGFIIFKIDPSVIKNMIVPGMYLPFLGLLFLAIWVTVGRVRQASLKGLVWAIGVTLFFGLRLIGLGHWVNLLLIGGVLISAEVYWRKPKFDKQGE